MKHFPAKEIAYAVGFIVLTVGLYAGSYYALVDRTIVWGPPYKFGGNAAKIIFVPIHKLDRLIRPQYWEIIPL